MSGAVTSSPRSGPAAPAAIGTPSRPASAATRRAFSVASSSGQLPATVVTASRSIASLPAASSSATASSWPGSQSRMIGVAISGIDGVDHLVDAGGVLVLDERGDRLDALALLLLGLAAPLVVVVARRVEQPERDHLVLVADVARVVGALEAGRRVVTRVPRAAELLPGSRLQATGGEEGEHHDLLGRFRASSHLDSGAVAGPVDLSNSPHARLQPLAAEIDGGVWAERQRLNREVLLVEGARKLEEAGNFHNLRVAAGQEEGDFVGMVFADSDVHKYLEALGWELAREPSEELAALSDAYTQLVSAAQQPDGYLNSYFQVAQPAEHFVNLAWDHELYCAGHLFQAAVAHARGTGDTRLLDVARRFADHIDGVFGPGRNEGTPGHPEIETALVELYRLTGERRYLDLAGFLVDTRGRETLQPARFGSAYFQDHVPVREATEVTGHCVRQLYLAAGVTDLHLETGEAALLDVLQSQWQDMVERKMYLTGGLGAHHMDEAFGDPYELPPDRCYGETCAASSPLHWNWRMLLLTGEARFADLFERALYNGFDAGFALDGHGYSYVNPLHVRDQHRGTVRHPWFACACCPPNVMRTLASLHHYLASRDDGGVQIHQYATGSIHAEAAQLAVTTDYPLDGRVEIEIAATDDAPW